MVDGRIAAAAQEERFTRKKHDARFPQQAITYCLQAAGIRLRDVDYVAFYDKPFLKFERLLETYLAFAPRGFRSFSMAVPLWVREKLFQKNLLQSELRRFDAEFDAANKLLFAEHHQSHAASAFFASPFEEAAVLTMDGVGEWATTSVGIGRGRQLQMQKEIHFPHSLGLLYSAFTYYLGFKVNSGEYKVMGLAPYGVPRYVDLIREHLIDVKPDGSFRLNLDYFDYCTGLRMTNARFERLFGGPARDPRELLTPRHMDIAASIQKVTEDVVLQLTRAIADETGARNLCLAGGVALNCVANGKVRRDGRFDGLWVQPAAGDAGGALGAALVRISPVPGAGAHAAAAGRDAGGLPGAGVRAGRDRAPAHAAGARFDVLRDADLIDATTVALAEGKAIGCFTGAWSSVRGPWGRGRSSPIPDRRRCSHC